MGLRGGVVVLRVGEWKARAFEVIVADRELACGICLLF